MRDDADRVATRRGWIMIVLPGRIRGMSVVLPAPGAACKSKLDLDSSDARTSFRML